MTDMTNEMILDENAEMMNEKVEATEVIENEENEEMIEMTNEEMLEVTENAEVVENEEKVKTAEKVEDEKNEETAEEVEMTHEMALNIAINTVKEAEKTTEIDMSEVIDKLEDIKKDYVKKLESAEKKKQEKAEAHKALREKIKTVLAGNNTPMKAADIAATLRIERGKVVYQLTAMAKEGEVIKVEGKSRKDPYSYKLA